MRYTPYVDLIFKKIFGTEENRGLLVSLVNAVLGDAYRLTELTLLNPYQPGAYLGDKLSILDIKAKDATGCHYNIEVQVADQVYYSQRALYYWSKLYTEQLKRGELFDQLHKTISIHVLNFNHLHEEADFHNVFHILNVKSRKRAFEDFEMHFIELKKFMKSPETTRMMSALERWVTFLSARYDYDREHIPPALQSDPAIVQAIEVLDVMQLTDQEREVYEGQQKWLRDEAGALQTAEQIGLEKGKVEVAINLLAAGHSPESLLALTGLPLETLLALQQSLRKE